MDKILIYAIILLVFVCCQVVARKRGGLHFTSCSNDTGRKYNILLHVAGIGLLGVFPLATLEPGGFSVNFWQLHAPYERMALISTLLSLAAAFIAYKEARRVSTGSEVIKMNSLQLAYWYFPIRIIYITGYEFFFRGVLLFSSLEIVNIWLAIIINTLFYLIAHILGPKKEIVGTLLMGPLLCIACIIAGSFWPAVFIHCTLTLFYEFNFIRFSYQPIKHPS